MNALKYFTKKNNVGYLGYKFKKVFGEMPVELPKKLNIQHRKLEREMNDKEILTELKPEEITLGDLAYALKKLNHDDWFLCYIKDVKDTLWTVNAYWDAYYRCWRVSAYQVAGSGRWGVGCQVISRNFGIENLGVENELPGELVINGVKYKQV